MTNEKIKLIVLEEHTLGYIMPNSKYAGVLHASVLKGASSGCPLSSMSPIWLEGKKIRLASKEDFKEFRVSFKGFENENIYEFSK